MLRAALILAVAVGVIALVSAARAHRRITRLKETVMADITDVNAAIDRNDQAQTEALNRVAEDVAELRRQVDAGAQAADLSPIVERLEASTARLQGVDPDPSFPAAQPPADETPVEPTPFNPAA